MSVPPPPVLAPEATVNPAFLREGRGRTPDDPQELVQYLSLQDPLADLTRRSSGRGAMFQSLVLVCRLDYYADVTFEHLK
jgi:hypothetical protein